MGPLRRNASGGLRSWSRRGYAVGSCAAPIGPTLVAAVVLALGKGLITCDAPLTREWDRSARLSGRLHPAALGGTAAAHIGVRVGKSGAVASPSASETGLDHP